jgi:hypothetical protein
VFLSKPLRIERKGGTEATTIAAKTLPQKNFQKSSLALIALQLKAFVLQIWQLSFVATGVSSLGWLISDCTLFSRHLRNSSDVANSIGALLGFGNTKSIYNEEALSGASFVPDAGMNEGPEVTQLSTSRHELRMSTSGHRLPPQSRTESPSIGPLAAVAVYEFTT